MVPCGWLGQGCGWPGVSTNVENALTRKGRTAITAQDNKELIRHIMATKPRQGAMLTTCCVLFHDSHLPHCARTRCSCAPNILKGWLKACALPACRNSRNSAPQPKFANRSANKSKNPSASTSCKTRAFLARFVTPHQSTTVAPRVSFELVSISTLHMRP